MYALYKKKDDAGSSHFEFIKQASLFGCNVGLIPKFLRQTTPKDQGEPYCWHLSIEKALTKSGSLDSTIIIDLKPKQKKENLSFYELLDVWGFSASDWTPILLHLSGLFVDADPSQIDRNNFEVSNGQREEPIYEFLYLDGSVSNGVLTGRWVPPPASPTNAALLWPSTLKYFVDCIQDRTPNVLK